jgi:hypothetical protein
MCVFVIRLNQKLRFVKVEDETTVDVLEAPNEKVRNAINIYAFYIIHTLLET